MLVVLQPSKVVMVVVNSCLCGFRRPKSNACTWSHGSSNHNLLRWSCTWKHKAHALMHNQGTTQIKEYKLKEPSNWKILSRYVAFPCRRVTCFFWGSWISKIYYYYYIWYRQLLNNRNQIYRETKLYLFGCIVIGVDRPGSTRVRKKLHGRDGCWVILGT
jgi:hypothetical protein